MPANTWPRAVKPLEGLPPLATPSARVLILGSMPGATSLQKREYYAHPRNQFWVIMERLFSAGRELPYAERCRCLTDCGVAVWDVVGRCRRSGSLDSNIAEPSVVVNDLEAFLRCHHRIHHVFFNGSKSEQIYTRHMLADVARIGRRIEYKRLPSTSPAHATMRACDKLRRWRVVAECAKI